MGVFFLLYDYWNPRYLAWKKTRDYKIYCAKVVRDWEIEADITAARLRRWNISNMSKDKQFEFWALDMLGKLAKGL